MAQRVTTIDELSQDDVDQLFAEYTQLMQEKHPEAELTRGVFHDTLLYFASIFAAVPQANINRYLQARSLLAIQANPSLADPEMTDHVLSNFNVTREPGSKSAGNITIVVDANETVIVPGAMEFEANGVSFFADTAFTGRPHGSDLPAITDRELVPLGDGTYAFTISATAAEEGADGNIRRGTKMIPQAVLPRFVTAYAANDFTDGFAAETNDALLHKQVLGVAAKSTASDTNLEAFIKNQETFARLTALSVVGMADPEMMRDQHWIMPISGGGRVDLYARTAALPRSTTKQVTATLVDITAAGGVWQFPVNKDFAPGFYEVERIAAPDDPDDVNYEVQSDLRGYDISDEVGLPDIATAEEAAYTKYQTAVIQFLDTRSTTGLTVNDTAVYNVSILAMPQIDELQDLLSSNANRHRMADTLVKGSVPCFLTLNFEIRKQPGEADPDVSAIANDLADWVNNLGYVRRLYGSAVSKRIHNYLAEGQAIGPIEMFGRIRRPDGSTAFIRDAAILTVPDDPVRMVTHRTVGFILDPRNVGIDIITLDNSDA